MVFTLGVVVSLFILCAKSYTSRANKFLAYFILIMSWFQIQPILYTAGLHLAHPSIYGFDIAFVLLLPAMVIFYFKIVTDEKYTWQKTDLFYLIPTVFQFINWCNYAIKDEKVKYEFVRNIAISRDYASTKAILTNNIGVYFAVLIVWLAISLWVTYRILGKFLSENLNKHWDREHYQTMQLWLKGFYALYLVMSLTFVFNYSRQVIFQDYHGGFIFTALPWIRNVLLVVFMIRIILFPEVLFGVPTYKYIKTHSDLDNRTLEDNHQFIIKENIDSEKPSGVNNLELSDALVAEYLNLIFKYVNEKHPQCLDDFSIESFCRSLNIPKSHFHYLLKYHFKETFVEYRSRLRIELACQTMQLPENKILTLEAIGQMVGFTSRYTFIRAFKKVKGIPPSEFIANVQ